MAIAKVYGIPNCGSVKKALDSLKSQGATIEFHDFKKLGVSAPLLDHWFNTLGLDKVINKKGTTWRGLSPELQAKAANADGAKAVLLEYPSVIKRPVVEYQGVLSIGQTDFS